MRGLIQYFKCRFGKHLWIEWEHNSDRRCREFIWGTTQLKDPECLHCGIRKSKTINK